jgi:hypothetical protein
MPIFISMVFLCFIAVWISNTISDSIRGDKSCRESLKERHQKILKDDKERNDPNNWFATLNPDSLFYKAAGPKPELKQEIAKLEKELKEPVIDKDTYGMAALGCIFILIIILILTGFCESFDSKGHYTKTSLQSNPLPLYDTLHPGKMRSIYIDPKTIVRRKPYVPTYYTASHRENSLP